MLSTTDVIRRKKSSRSQQKPDRPVIERIRRNFASDPNIRLATKSLRFF
jgi:hypothetical protein